MLEPFGIERSEENPEETHVTAADAMVRGIAADRDVGDRRLPAERAILPVEPERIEGAEVEIMPGLGRNLFRQGIGFDLVGIFLGQLRQPVGGARRARQAVAEGASEFFAASSTNSTSTRPICSAHQMTALATSR